MHDCVRCSRNDKYEDKFYRCSATILICWQLPRHGHVHQSSIQKIENHYIDAIILTSMAVTVVHKSLPYGVFPQKPPVP